MPATVITVYTNHSDLAVSVMRGASFSSFTAPGVSARYICMPPTPSSGRMATAITMMPRPPNQCRDARQKLREGGRPSSPDSTVEPVVVSPDMDSKKASVKLSPGKASRNGIDAAAETRIQPRVTSRNPSRGFSSRR